MKLTWRVLFKNISILLCILAVWIIPATISLASLGDGLVGYWPFDEGTGSNVLDRSGSNNNGMIVTSAGFPKWTNDAKAGKALLFNGAGYVSIPTSPSLTLSKQVSLSFWFKAGKPTTGYAYQLIKKLNSTMDAMFAVYYFGQKSSEPRAAGTIEGWGNAGGKWGTLSNYFTLIPSNWYFITLTYDEMTGGQLYVDSYLMATAKGRGALVVNNHPLIIGPFDGIIDEVQLYNRVLTAGEIKISFQTISPFAIKPVKIDAIKEGETFDTLIILDGRTQDVSISASNMPAGAVFYPRSNRFVWTPQKGQLGDFDVLFTAVNGNKSFKRLVRFSVKENTFISTCVNTQTARCLDIGSNVEAMKGGDFPLTSFGGKETNGTITSRSLLPKKDFYFSFSAFNADEHGFPSGPMLLEIKYKDTIADIKEPYVTIRHKAFIFSRNDYKSDDPLNSTYTRTTVYDYKGAMGNNADGSWRVAQCLFPQASKSLLKAINGKYMFYISMPKQYPADDTLILPIDYISLKVISSQDAEAFAQKNRGDNGFIRVALPDDKPTNAVSYNNPKGVMFTRDLMHPIYQHTRPSQTEISGAIINTAFPGEIEPLSVGIYSQSGLKNAKISISDLKSVSSLIEAINIKIFTIVYRNGRLREYFNKEYAIIPDSLDERDSFEIAPDKSQQIVFHVYVADNTAAGVYKGVITLKEGNQVISTMPVAIEVTPFKLDGPKQLHSIYHDPFGKTFTNKQEEVYKFFREAQLVPFFWVLPNYALPVKDIKTNEIESFDLSLMDRRIVKMQEKGLIHNKVFVELGSNTPAIYKLVFQKPFGPQELDLYNKLSDSKFVKTYELFIGNLMDLAKMRNVTFIFSVWDEPGVNPYARIVTDRLFTIIKSLGGLTTATYYVGCENGVPSGSFHTPAGIIPSLAPLVDYKVWELKSSAGPGYLKRYDNFGFYTTAVSYLRNPIYNRFLHGLYASKTNAAVISVYAMGDYTGEVEDDFDPCIRRGKLYPDFILAYPSWSGKLIPTFAAEGIREGIKDARLVSTLQRLISQNPGALADEAKQYLATIFSRINSDPTTGYLNKYTQTGFYEQILKDLSGQNDDVDYAVFTNIRKKMAQYIVQLIQLTQK